MTRKDRINNLYFEWMSDLVCFDRFSDEISYRKLLMFLHKTEFTYTIPMDINRAKDGGDLRYRFAYEHPDFSDAELYLEGPCSVLEMLVALSLRCEETLMDNTQYGNRTSQWFWEMIVNLGLGSMYDDQFDRRFVKETINTFLNREYSPNGKGGLFKIKNCKYDLRTVEIWKQLNWYLDSIIG